MRITDAIDYAAPPERVFAMLADERFQRRACQATGALGFEATVRVDGDRTVITTRRAMPTGGFPDFVKGMVGPTLPLVQTDDWGPAGPDGSRRGTLMLEVSRAPLGIAGELTLSPGGSGTLERIVCDLTARVPLFGSRIESAAAPAVQAGIDVQRRTGTAWLQDH